MSVSQVLVVLKVINLPGEQLWMKMKHPMSGFLEARSRSMTHWPPKIVELGWGAFSARCLWKSHICYVWLSLQRGEASLSAWQQLSPCMIQVGLRFFPEKGRGEERETFHKGCWVEFLLNKVIILFSYIISP